MSTALLEVNGVTKLVKDIEKFRSVKDSMIESAVSDRVFLRLFNFIRTSKLYNYGYSIVVLVLLAYLLIFAFLGERAPKRHYIFVSSIYVFIDAKCITFTIFSLLMTRITGWIQIGSDIRHMSIFEVMRPIHLLMEMIVIFITILIFMFRAVRSFKEGGYKRFTLALSISRLLFIMANALLFVEIYATGYNSQIVFVQPIDNIFAVVVITFFLSLSTLMAIILSGVFLYLLDLFYEPETESSRNSPRSDSKHKSGMDYVSSDEICYIKPPVRDLEVGELESIYCSLTYDQFEGGLNTGCTAADECIV